MTKDHAYLYLGSVSEARRQNELALWRASHLENIACKQAIEEAIRRGFDGMHLSHDCARGVIEDFVSSVWDGCWPPRFSKSNTMDDSVPKTKHGPHPPSFLPATAITSLPWRVTPLCWMASLMPSRKHRQS